MKRSHTTDGRFIAEGIVSGSSLHIIPTQINSPIDLQVYVVNILDLDNIYYFVIKINRTYLYYLMCMVCNV